jgi:IMP dehydrogenase
VRSACTYTGARTLDEFADRAVIGVQTVAGFTEGTAHGR